MVRFSFFRETPYQITMEMAITVTKMVRFSAKSWEQTPNTAAETTEKGVLFTASPARKSRMSQRYKRTNSITGT